MLIYLLGQPSHLCPSCLCQPVSNKISDCSHLEDCKTSKYKEETN